MAQITTTDANEFSSSAEFIPMRGFSNCHLQTMLPRLFRRQAKFTPYWQRLELPDGDFVDLAWSESPALPSMWFRSCKKGVRMWSIVK